MSLPLDSMKEQLKEILGRDVTVSKVTFAGQSKFLADYVNHAAPATKLVADTEDQAIEKLFIYLSSKQPDPPELNKTQG